MAVQKNHFGGFSDEEDDEEDDEEGQVSELEKRL